MYEFLPSSSSEWEYLEAHFGSSGQLGSYIQLSFSEDKTFGSDVKLRDVSVKACYEPCKLYVTTLIISHYKC